MARRIIHEPSRALSELRLLPGLTMPASTPERISFETRLAKRPGTDECVRLRLPLLGAAMQAVSGPELAIALAREGGVAFVFASQPVDQQAQMVRRVKQHKAGFVRPVCVRATTPIAQVARLSGEHGFSTFPVVGESGEFLGLITRNDFEESVHGGLVARERMVPSERLVVGRDTANLQRANEALVESHQNVLPIVDEAGRLQHLVFRKDIRDHSNHPDQVVDSQKRLLVGAAINTHDHVQRVPALVEAGVDVIAIDSSDGHSFYQKAVLDWLAEHHPTVPVVAGNIVTAEGFRYLADAGAGAVKIGMGGGSICITQEQKGTGRGLGSAIMDVAQERDRYLAETGRYIPLIADGGIVHAKDIALALALGADSVMLGRYFARTEESPPEKVTINGRVMKPYWGEGSARAREWRGQRYGQAAFAEGVEGYVEYAGRVRDNVAKTVAILRSTFSSCGAATIADLHQGAVVEVVSALSIREGQVHDVYLPPADHVPTS